MTHITTSPDQPEPRLLYELDLDEPDLLLDNRLLALGSSAVAVVLILIGVAAIFLLLGPILGLPLTLLVLLLYGWMLSAFLRYRQGRQDEFLHLLATAVESQAPLAPVLRAYLRDRPHGSLREFWVAVLLFFVVPGYYWLWYRWHSYDRKIARVALLLERGFSLQLALQATRGVASRDILLAVAIGQATGQVALCLRNMARSRLASVWLELLPRILYPLGLVIFIGTITSFYMVFIFPKMQKIYKDFKVTIPSITEKLGNAWKFVFGDNAALLLLSMFLATLGLVFLLIFSTTARWYFPGVGRVYRRYLQSRLAKMLGLLLQAGKPIPEALVLLAKSGYFPPVAQDRLSAVLLRVEQGQPWAESLALEGLLPAWVVPLLQSAERMRNLPWALNELGETLDSRMLRTVQRITMIVSPTLVIAIGVLVGIVVIGMFVPLVDLMAKLSDDGWWNK